MDHTQNKSNQSGNELSQLNEAPRLPRSEDEAEIRQLLNTNTLLDGRMAGGAGVAAL